jgi:ParB family chromosome partitioning protein
MRRSLGKGLSHLITEQLDVAPTDAAITSIVANKRQPRTQFDESTIAELSESIKQHGILQPLLVRSAGANRFELIAGERRLRAAGLAGLKRVPIIVRKTNGQESLELALIENLQREDIGPLECAAAYKQLNEEFGLTQDQIALRVGKSRAAITNTLRLLRLPKVVLEGLQGGAITEGHARALLALERQADQLAMYERIVRHGLSVREVEAACRQPLELKTMDAKPSDPNWDALQESLAKRIGSPVIFKRKAKGGGQMIVSYFSDEDLERILSSLGLAD